MKKEIQIISDFNSELFYNYLNNIIDKKTYNLNKPNFEMFASSCYKIINSKRKNHVLIAWNRAEVTIKEFSNLLMENKLSEKKLFKEVDDYINLILKLSEKTENLILFSWSLPYLEKGHYLKDLTDVNGISYNLNKMNLRISDAIKKKSNIYLFNIDFLLQKNNEPFNPKLWYATKTPYNNKLFEIASVDFKEIIENFTIPRKKLLILDLDNTLWGGVIGDLGWKKINLGGHNYIGEAFVDFQKKIKSLKGKGIQLAIISKNDEKIALEAFKKNKEMILKLNDFATWRINWKDKAQNLQEIVKELNLSTDSCVFIDDNINERNRIKTAFPEILVPDWPNDPSYYSEEFLKLNCFNSNYLTKEDENRTQYYKDEKKREKTKKNFLSHDKWLNSLKIKVKIENINEENKLRVLQLINKTNQMNLSTRRYSEKELNQILKDKRVFSGTIRVKDKLGDMGLVGIFIIEIKQKEINVLDFILSCRAFGRSIENYMFYQINLYAKKNRIKKVVFRYKKTKKNQPTLEFLKSLKLKKNDKNNYIFNNEFKILKPKHLN